jgi:protein-L-isoaspartate(D-aspartate) O-methyltransferase
MTDYKSAREHLIEELSSQISDKRVLAAMSRLPRELFIPLKMRDYAYDNRPLPIGFEQTISQPLIIALMTQSLELTGCEKVLEVGTGSGYQTAILAELANKVVSVERIPQLAKTAQKTLESLGYKNVDIHVAGDTLGWSEGRPYDAIMVTAGAPELPHELLSQMANKGRMVIPIGSRQVQELYKITKQEDRNIIEKLGGCRFVSLIGKTAWKE